MDDGRGATPFRIPVTGSMPQGEVELARNAQANAVYPKIGREPAKMEPLAICGGGPSLADNLDALGTWPGPIWAVNRTADWLSGHDIPSVMVTVDASDNPDHFSALAGEAICASWCNPSVVSRYPVVRIVEMFPLHPDGVVGTTTTAGCMAMLAGRMGYRSVTLFGCEGSFSDADHVDRHDGQTHQFIIRANGAEYRTTPDLLMQCDEISRLIQAVPHFLSERSGGLLRAMISDPDWETAAVSGPLKHELETAGMTGIHDTLYQGAFRHG
jgi:hypothetical protein